MNAPIPRVGRYMHTSNGKKYWPLDPRPEEVHIEVIAHHLAMICRYNGATAGFYSVAEHSYWCSFLVPPKYALEALLHDGSETYLNDLIRPLKYDESFRKPFLHVEELNERAIARRFQLQYPFPIEVKIADDAMAAAEIAQIVVKDPDDEWVSGKLHDDTTVAPVKIECWSPEVARGMFLKRYDQLIHERGQ